MVRAGWERFDVIGVALRLPAKTIAHRKVQCRPNREWAPPLKESLIGFSKARISIHGFVCKGSFPESTVAAERETVSK